MAEYSPLSLEEVHAAQDGPICPNYLNTDILPSSQRLKIGEFPEHDWILTELHGTFCRDGCREHHCRAKSTITGADSRARILSRACSILFSASEYVLDILQAMVVGRSMMWANARYFLH
jgi:hypothetical protein